MLQVKMLSKKIHKKEILKNVSFEVRRGEIAVFLGRSGVGKSTLLRVLNNLDSYDSGTFFLDNQELQIEKNTIGMVFQHFNLFEHLTVEENISFVLRKTKKMEKAQAKLEAQLLLEKYGLLDKAALFCSKLSGGQKQRLAIARTVALTPEVICLDEPTSALDPHLTGQVATFIQEFARDNKVLLLTTHDLALLAELKEATLFLMHEGTIIEVCQKTVYMQNPGNYPALQRFLNGHHG